MTQQNFYKAVNLDDERSRNTPLAFFDKGKLINVVQNIKSTGYWFAYPYAVQREEIMRVLRETNVPPERLLGHSCFIPVVQTGFGFWPRFKLFNNNKEQWKIGYPVGFKSVSFRKVNSELELHLTFEGKVCIVLNNSNNDVETVKQFINLIEMAY
jgi:hypothetical protein